MLKKKKAVWEKIVCIMFAAWFALTSLSMSTIEANAHDAYFLGVTFDTDSCRYIGTVSFQSNSLIGDNHAESEITCDFHKIYTDSAFNRDNIKIDYATNSSEELESVYAGVGIEKNSSFSNSTELLFTFPGFHTKGVVTAKLNANGTDQLLAERVSNTVIGNLNNAIDFIVENTQENRTDSNSICTLGNEIMSKIKTQKDGSGSGSGTIYWEGHTITYTYGNSSLPSSATIKESDIPNGFTPEDYVEFTVNGKSACFVYQVWKGYKYPGYADSSKSNHNSALEEKYQDDYARDISGNDWYKNEGHKGVCKIGWDAIILQAHFNKDVMGVNFSNLGDILPSSALISAIANLCDFVITGIRSFLGLYALDELMLNRGTRGLGYSMGLFPNGWVAPIYLLFTICLMITWAIMGFAVIKIFMKRSLATINVGEKIAIMNELKNLAVCCFLLGAFPLVFNMLARINFSLVSLFGSSTSFSSMLKSFYTLSQGNFGSIIACFMGLALQIYFNFFYILRAITLAILYGIAPFAIYTIVLGGKNAKVFSAWSKELLSNIFVQTLHAMMIAFFASVSGFSGLKTFESIVVLYSFIPLTKFVKQNVFQASDGIGGMAGGLTSGLAGAAGAFAGSATGGGNNSSSSGSYSGTGGGNGSGGGNPATGIMADRLAKTNSIGSRKPASNFSDNARLNATKDGAISNRINSWANGKHHFNGTQNLADKINGMNSGTGMRSVSQFMDGQHDTKMGSAIAKVGNGFRERKNRRAGWGEGMTLTPVNSEDQSAIRSEGPSRIIADSKYKANAGARVGAIGSGLAKGTLKGVGGLAMSGFAIGMSSFDEAGGARMLRNGMGQLGNGVNEARNGIVKGFGMGHDDKILRQHMKNHGIKSISEDSKNIYKTYDDVSYDADHHDLVGDGVSRLTEAERNTLRNHYRAADSSSDMPDKERAFYRSQASRQGLSFSVQSAGGESADIKSGNCVVVMDKAVMAQQKNVDLVTHGSVMSQYHEQPNAGKSSGETDSETINGNETKQQPVSSGGNNNESDYEEVKPNTSSTPEPEKTEPVKQRETYEDWMKEEENYYRDSLISSEEAMKLDINAPGKYGNEATGNFSKGDNPRKGKH